RPRGAVVLAAAGGVGGLLGEGGERFDEGGDDPVGFRDRRRRQEARGQQQDQADSGCVDDHGHHGGGARTAALGGIAPLRQQVKFSFGGRWNYGFHPASRVRETISECSSILSRIDRATPSVLRAAGPAQFGWLR